MKNRTYLTKAHIGTIVKGTLLATALVTSTLMAGCKDNDTETTDAEVVAEADASTEKGSAAAEKNGKASGTTATAGNSSTEVENAEEDNASATTEATRTSTDRQAASTESTSKATGTTASSRGNNSTTETSRANATTEASRPASTTETSKPNSTTEAPKPSNSTTEAPTTPAHTHTWVENTEAVYVPEVGHYEEVMVDPGGEVPHYVEHTLCAHCGYDYTIDPDNCGLSHTCPDGTYSSYGSQMVQDGYITIPPYYEKRWIVDTPAHTEQQGNGTYKCSTCGAEK